MIIEELKIFDKITTEHQKDFYISKGNSITLQVIGESVNLSIEGSIINEKFNVIYPVMLEGYITEPAITKAGLYVIPIEGINKIKFTNNGDPIEVIGKVVE